MSKVFKYPNKNVLKTFSFTPAEQNVFNEFPRYSITFYDDENFAYRRQSFNGRPILSKIISDDFYPFNLSLSDRTNYISGQSNVLKVFFAKILVHKAMPQDSVGQNSNVFFLTRTQTLGTSKTIYYTVKCVEKNDQFTVYSSRISLNNSDFVNQSDGETFFTLVGDFSVSLNYPISLTINNSASTSIAETTTVPVYNTISTSVNNLNFYETVVVDFDYFQYSDSFNYNFSPLTLTLNDNIFSSTPVIYTTNTSTGTSIRFNFLTGYSVNNIKNFGLTLANSSTNYNPATDTLFVLTFRLDNGEFVTFNGCEIFNNIQSGFYNIVFDFIDVAWPGSFINYFILEIKTITSNVSSSYQITFLNFIKEVNNVNAFAVKTFSQESAQNNFTLQPNNESLLFENLKNKLLIKSSEIFSTVESLIKVKHDTNFLITTESSSIILPENSLIKTENIYVPIFDLNKNTKIKVFDTFESILTIKTLPSSYVELIDTYEDSDYILNGFEIKNPIYSKQIERKFLPSQEPTEQNKTIKINENIFSLTLSESFGFINRNVNFSGSVTNEIQIEDKYAKKFFAYIVCSDPVYVIYNEDVKLFSDKEIIELNLKHDLRTIILKSKSSFTIKKLLIVYEL